MQFCIGWGWLRWMVKEFMATNLLAARMPVKRIQEKILQCANLRMALAQARIKARA